MKKHNDGGLCRPEEGATVRPVTDPDAPGNPAAEYLLQLLRFVREFDIPRDLPSRVRKAGEELGELAEAVAVAERFAGERSAVREEAADLVTVGIDTLIASGLFVDDVIPFLIKNLDRKAEKYRQGRNRTEERR